MALTPFDGELDAPAGLQPFDGRLDGEKSGFLRRGIGDTAVSLGKGVIGAGEGLVGLASLATAGAAGRLAEQAGFRPKEAKSILDELYSPEQQAANRAVSEAKGIGGTLSAIAQNPSVIPHSIVESLPSMLGGQAIAKGGLRAAGLAGEAITPTAARLAGAAGEGAITAGSVAEQIRQDAPNGNIYAAVPAGILTGAIGVAGGKLANKMGLGDIDTALLTTANRGTASLPKRVVGGAISEGLLEEAPQSAQEQAFTNLGTGKPLMEGVPEAAALGGVVGGAMGGGFGVLSKPAGPLSRAAETATATGADQEQQRIASEQVGQGVGRLDATGETDQASYSGRIQPEQQQSAPQSVQGEGASSPASKSPLGLPQYSGPTQYVFPDGSVSTDPQAVRDAMEAERIAALAPQPYDAPLEEARTTRREQMARAVENARQLPTTNVLAAQKKADELTQETGVPHDVVATGKMVSGKPLVVVQAQENVDGAIPGATHSQVAQEGSQAQGLEPGGSAAHVAPLPDVGRGNGADAARAKSGVRADVAVRDVGAGGGVDGAAARASRGHSLSVTPYAVTTEDGGTFDAIVHRLKDGGALVRHSSGVMEYNAEFANGKTDSELLKYSFDPEGFVNATQSKAAEIQQQPAQQNQPGRAEARAAQASQGTVSQEAAVPPPATGAQFDVSGKTPSQLAYLSTNGQPGWKEAAQAEIARRAGAKESSTTQPPDLAQVNVPLSKRGNIDAELDRYKASQAAQAKQEAKTATAQRKADKARAKELFAQHGEAIIAAHGAKFGEKETRKTLDSMVKWEPAKFIQLVDTFQKEQATTPATLPKESSAPAPVTPQQTPGEPGQAAPTAEQAIRAAWQSKTGVTLGSWHPLTVEHGGVRRDFLANQKKVSSGKNESSVHLVSIRNGRLLRSDPIGPLAYYYKLDGKNNLVEEGIPSRPTELQLKKWRSSGFVVPGDQPTKPQAPPSATQETSSSPQAVNSPQTQNDATQGQAQAGENGKTIQRGKSRSLLELIRRNGGIHTRLQSDIAGDKAAGKRGFPVGVFRSNGLGEDRLAELLQQHGYLSEADVNSAEDTSGAGKAMDMVRRALNGERVLSIQDQEAERSAAEEAQYKERVKAKARELGLKVAFRKFDDVEADVLAKEAELIAKEKVAMDAADRRAYDDLAAMARGLLPADEADAILEDVSAKHADSRASEFLAAAEDAILPRINAVLHDIAVQQGPTDEERAAEFRRTAERQAGQDETPSGQGTSPGSDATPFSLQSQTESELRAREEGLAKQREQEAEAQRKADEKAQADREVGGFTLTGSDRPADTMAAQGQGGLFDSPSQPRFEAGKALTKEQRKQVLGTLVDVYKGHAEKEFKGLDSNGNERYGYVYSPDLFVKSDITGSMVRYYVTMPDGRRAHPTELFPDYTQSDIDAEFSRRSYEERNALSDAKRFASENYQFGSISELENYWDKESEESKKRSVGGWATVAKSLDRTVFKNGDKYISVADSSLSSPWLVDALSSLGWGKQGQGENSPSVAKENSPQVKENAVPLPSEPQRVKETAKTYTRSSENEQKAEDSASTGEQNTPPSVFRKDSDAINVDGVERPRTNSNGQPIHPTEDGIRNFWRWFGDSKVVDEQGRPLVVYHGTTADFTSFDASRLGEKTGGADAREGFFFAANAKAADQFTWDNGEKTGSIMPVYLDIKNPARSTTKLDGANGRSAARELSAAKATDRDGVVFDSDMLGHTGDTWIAFRPEQIKSAAGNNGNFGPSNPSIVLRNGNPESASVNGVARSDADAFVRDFLRSYPGAPPVVLTDTYDSLPANVRRDAGNQGGGKIKGALNHRDGKVYVVVGNHTSMADFSATVFHEVLGHAGVRALFGKEFVQELNKLFLSMGGLQGLAKIMKSRGMDRQFSQYIKGVAEARGKDPKVWNGAIANAVLTEEVFAHAAEQPRMMDRMKALIGMVRDWLRKHGFAELAKLGETDMLFMLQRARVALKQGGSTVVRNGVEFGDKGMVDAQGNLIAKEGSPEYDALRILADKLGLTERSGATVFSRGAGKGDAYFRSDVPSDKWLKEQIDYAKSRGRDQFGVPYMGKVTGSFRGFPQAPVAVLADIPGERGEQQNVRQNDLDWLIAEMRANGLENVGVPYVEVGYDGKPFVSEGNHRIMAAKALGWESMPVEIRYFDGGERVDGALRPDKILGYHASPSTVFRKESYASDTERQTFGRMGEVLNRLAGSGESVVGNSGRPYTPEQEQFFRNTGRTVTKPTIQERMQALWKDAGKKLAQGMVDQFAPIKELSSKAYMLARLSKGATGAFEALLHYGKLSLRDGVYDADRSGGAIEKVFAPLQGEGEDFLWWVAANRAERLSKEDREHLFTQNDIAAGKSLADGDLSFDYTLQNNLIGHKAGEVTRSRKLAYQDSIKTFESFNRNVMDMAEQSGLIDGAARKLWEHEFYVPFYRVNDEDGFRGANIKSALVRQQAFKQLKGGSDKLNSDLLANTLQNWAHLIDASSKNRAAKATLEAAAAMGAARPAIPGEKKTVWYSDGGKKAEFVVEDPYLMTAISSLEYAGLRGPMMDAMSMFKRVLSVGVTASPFYKVRNLIRDSIQSIGVSELSANPINNIKQGYKASDRSSQTFVSMLAAGGFIRFGTMLEGNEASRARKLVMSGVKEGTILNTESKVRQMYDKYIEPAISAYNELGNRGEEINRAALYQQLRDKGMDHGTASFMARDLMDFSMQGAWTSVRLLTQVVPFMNARLQGLYKLGRGAKDNPRKFGAVLGSVALASIMLMLAYKDDDDWKKREDWDRDNYWWFKLGGQAFRIPKPFEIGAIGSLAERGLEYMISDEMTGKRLSDRFLALLSDNLSMNPVPQLVKPIIDVYANKDSFSGRPIETLGMDRLAPEYRYNANTSMAARALSTAGNAVTGVVGKDFLSPVQIDQMIRGYFGWLGTFVVGAADHMVKPLTSEPTSPAVDYWKLATGGMVQNLDGASSRYVSQLYQQAKIVEEAYATHRQLLKDGRVEEAKDYFDDNREEISGYRRIEALKRQEAKINAQIRAIEKSDMPADQKREEINALRSRQDRTARLMPAAGFGNRPGGGDVNDESD